MMPPWLRILIDLLGRLFGRTASTPTAPAGPAPWAPPATAPRIPVDQYRFRLKNEVARKGVPPRGWENTPDDPATTADERRTWCNLFVRTIVRWFGYTAWTPPDRDGERAAGLVDFMRVSPDWQRVDYDQARVAAIAGCCVVAGWKSPTPSGSTAKWQASGHVMIVAPEDQMVMSQKWKRAVPLGANVGGSNHYGKGINHAFGAEPELFLLVRPSAA